MGLLSKTKLNTSQSDDDPQQNHLKIENALASKGDLLKEGGKNWPRIVHSGTMTVALLLYVKALTQLRA